ncbi:MAG: septal ring lytic transglycosylase RlpA family protein [Leptolyngbya sp. LCM1.Bin17]|nr:MAG: septal ring lytic transglycosylase RlpA family protein [Leptolyngbya sp. LCM1.Bin17]
MKHRVIGGLTVAVAMSVLGAPLPSQAQDSGDSHLDAQTQHNLDILSLSDSEISETGLSAISDASSIEPADPESATLAASPVQEFESATVFAHALDARQAATIYIRSIPVVTLIGGELETLSSTKSDPDLQAATGTDVADAGPVAQANLILARLEGLAADSEVEAIKARWDDDDEAFVVSWQDEDLLTVNSRIILPDTTEDPAEDALHIANRLRRLLGDAPPLEKVEGMPEPPQPQAVAVVASTLTGMASWYGPGFHGRRSASGEVFDQNALTAAHRTLPFGTQVRVTNLNNGRQVVVRINDRGPFSGGRVIDLSAAAASSIGLRSSGVGRVRLEVLSTP